VSAVLTRGRLLLRSGALSLCLAAMSGGCGQSSHADRAPDTNPSPADVRAVLAAAADHRATVANSFGGHSVFTSINVVETLGAPMQNGMVDDTVGRVVTDDEKAAITEALKPATVHWIVNTSAVLGTRPSIHDSYQTLGAILTLSEPRITGDRAEITTEREQLKDIAGRFRVPPRLLAGSFASSR